jgi:hypothetical protein
MEIKGKRGSLETKEKDRDGISEARKRDRKETGR